VLGAVRLVPLAGERAGLDLRPASERRDGLGVPAIRRVRHDLPAWPVRARRPELCDQPVHSLAVHAAMRHARVPELPYTRQPWAELLGLTASHLIGGEPMSHGEDVAMLAHVPERRGLSRRIRPRVPQPTEAGLGGKHREQRAVVLPQVNRYAGMCRRQAERALCAQQPVEVGHERLPVSGSRCSLAWIQGSEPPDVVELSAQTAQYDSPVGDPRGRDFDRGTPDLELSALAASELVALEEPHKSTAVLMRPNGPANLWPGGAARRDRSDRAVAGPLLEPPDERGVIVPQRERHHAAVRLTAVLLDDAEMRLALDEAGDEMSLGGGKPVFHLQIIRSGPAENRIQRSIRTVSAH